MREPTDRLIEKLAQDAAPVTPLASPFVRAGVWLSAVTVAFAVIVVATGAGSAMWLRLADTFFAVELAAAFLTGVTAILAATTLAVPGRAESWIYLPLPSAVVWFGLTGVRCYRHVAEAGAIDWSPFADMKCFVFIMLAGIPLAVALFFALRRAASVNLASVTALGGLGVAALAATLLQFFHPPSATPVDVATHAAAIAAIVVFMTTFARRALVG